MDRKKLFSSVKIGKVEMKNRFAMAPMGPLGLADAEGGFNQRGIDYYTRRAAGGAGLIITGVTFSDYKVETQSMPNCPCSTYNPVHFIRTGKELTERVHAYGARIFLQMSAGFGRVTIPTNLGEFPPVAPSPIPHRWLDKTCRPLEIEEIRSIVKSFGDGAYNAKRAGFDGVEIHAVHEGYLLDQFAISFFNQRTDDYGGCIENRLRFAREVLDEIKSRCGDDFPVALRFSVKSMIKDWREGALPGEEFEEKGRDIEEGLEAARLLTGYGYDALDVDAGSYDAWWWSHPPMYQEKGLYRSFCHMVKDVVDVPVICAGRMDDPDMAAASLEAGDCDMISLGRPLLADPDLVNKIRKGNTEDIRPCISCQEGCMGRIQEYSMINCAVNPQTARERFAALNPVVRSKRVMIVGGGVAGCEAARVLAERGHRPEIFERSDRLGGNLIPGGVPEFKKDDRDLVRWYETQLSKLQVPVHFGAAVTAETSLDGFDVLIVATGSEPKVFSLGDDEHTHTAADVLEGKASCGGNVTVLGGGLIGCETGLWLAQNGRKVTVIDVAGKLMSLNGPICSANREMLERLVERDCTVLTGTSVRSFRDGVLTYEKDGGTASIPCDDVVMAVGYRENNALYEAFRFEADELYLLGDARKVANIMYAIWDAYEVANHI